MTIPESLGLCFAIWDRSDRIANEFVSERCRDLTDFYLKSCFPEATVFEHQDIDRLLKTAAQTKANWCLVQARGHLLMRFDFYQELERFLNANSNRFLVMGHILDRKSSYFEIHNQCFLVNLRIYREIGMPGFGREMPGSTRLIKPVRSPENFHDDYTPPWLKPSDSKVTEEFRGLHDGHGFVAASIASGLSVQGFTRELRDRKHFLYPEASTTEFERALRDPSYAPTDSLNQGQRRFLSGMRQNWFACRSSVFLFNTDDIRNTQRVNNSNSPLATLYSVASGFRPIKLLERNGFDSNTNVVYFDYSEAALEFRRELVEQFDGGSFVDFLRDRSSSFEFGHYQARPIKAGPIAPGEAQFAEQFSRTPNFDVFELNWNRTLEAFGGPESFRSLWRKIRELPHRYIHTDIFDSPSDLTSLVQTESDLPRLIWWSNSFSTESTRTFIPRSTIERAYRNFEFVLGNADRNLLIDGFSVDNELKLGRVN